MSKLILRPLKLMLALLVAVSLSATGVTGPSLAKADTGTSNHGMMIGFKLTPAQVNALKQAWAAHQQLTSQQAEDIINRVGGTAAGAVAIKPAYAGFDESYGTCSHMWMWGYSSGYYDWNMSEIGYPSWSSFGEISISTNGVTASVDDHWFGSGFYQRFTGTLLWTGFGASGTTMSGWMVTQDSTYCSGTLFARW